MGIPEQQWENYELTKQRVFSTIAASKGTSKDPNVLAEAKKTEIFYCTRVRCFNPNTTRLISVMFQKRKDKEQLLKNKTKLPPGLYVNEEFLMQVKKVRDKLRPIYRMAKSNPKYKEKCRLQGDKLVIDGIKYTVDNLADLPEERSACQTAEKSNEDTLVFHGEYSPFSNFHHSTFQIDGIEYPTAEHYIQYQKSLLFGNSVTANKILRSTTPLKAKKTQL